MNTAKLILVKRDQVKYSDLIKLIENNFIVEYTDKDFIGAIESRDVDIILEFEKMLGEK